ncbi:Phycobilisome core-membrane linker polypeptide [Synechococcus sp. WH 8101]|nr:Phycobilisome core-membrane linker polypeptide [Synechococcus sp. WH 8101]
MAPFRARSHGLQTFVHALPGAQKATRNLAGSGLLSFMTVTASSGSPRVSPQLFDTLPLSSVRQAEQQDRFPDGAELDNLVTFFRSGQDRLAAAQVLAANAEAIVARAANRIFAGGTPLSFLDAPLSTGETSAADGTPLASDQVAFAQSVRTFTGADGSAGRGNFLSRLLQGSGEDADVRVVLPTGFAPISVAKYGPDRMRKSIRDLGWFLRYVGYALVAGDPSILAVNTRGLRDVLEKGCSLAATNVALQEMRAAAASLLKQQPEARRLTVQCFNVLLEELAIPTPSARQRLGSPENQGLQLPAIYALAAKGKALRYTMKPAMTGAQKAEVVRAAYRQVFERDITKAYSQKPCPVEATQVRQGDISMREFIRALGRSKEYRQQFYARFSNSRAVELAFRHFLGRGISSREEFTRYFDIVSTQGLNGLVDALINTMEYARVFGEETVPFLRDLGEEAQESAGWGSNRKLFRFSAPFEGAPQYVTLYASYRQPCGDQHAYGGGNDPLGIQYGAIFPSATASVATRPAPAGYDNRRILVGNGMREPGQMASPQFRGSTPRRVGPRVMRLQQIATGGNSIPRRAGQPSIRGTESSTQAVINAVYVQVLGSAGYEGERNKVEEIKLENGDISLREFVRQVARSQAFRRRYWSGLYLTKAIEVMHRRLLGRPTFGRWEIDALFDTAAQHGFYGVVDALINSSEYNDCFGEDTVPYERFITPTDLRTRRVPALKRPVDLIAAGVATTYQRPNVLKPKGFRSSADLTRRNLADRPTVRGSWTAQLTGGQVQETRPAQQQGPESLRSQPIPRRRWSAPRWQPGGGQAPSWSSASATAAPIAPKPSALAGAVPSWSSTSSSVGFGLPETAETAMRKALAGAIPTGLRRREGLDRPLRLAEAATGNEIDAAIQAIYRQLLNRMPVESERLSDAESLFRQRRLSVAEFVGRVAASELFQQRLWRMAPLRAATAAHLALLGRAPLPREVSVFLATRVKQGQQAAIDRLLSSEAYANAFGADQIPSYQGMNSQDGITMASFNRGAALYGGNAGLNPPLKGAI